MSSLSPYHTEQLHATFSGEGAHAISTQTDSATPCVDDCATDIESGYLPNSATYTDQPTDPHFTEDWAETDLSLDDPLIHGRHARAWAQVGQKALDRKLNENDG